MLIVHGTIKGRTKEQTLLGLVPTLTRACWSCNDPDTLGRLHEDPVNFPDIDSPLDNIDPGDERDHPITLGTLRSDSTMTKDNPDPFMVEHHNSQGTVNMNDSKT